MSIHCQPIENIVSAQDQKVTVERTIPEMSLNIHAIDFTPCMLNGINRLKLLISHVYFFPYKMCWTYAKTHVKTIDLSSLSLFL